MTSQEEFTAFLHSDPKAGYQNDGGKDDPEWMSSWAQRGQSSGYGSTSPIAGAPKPPQAPRRVSPLNSEQSPLLQPPSPVKPPPKQPTAGPPRPKSHGRSRSDFVWASQDPSHPLMTGGTSKPSGPSGLPPMKHHRSSSRGNKPPRVATSGTMALPGASALGMSAPPATPTGASGRGSHRRAKSDIPTSFGGHRSISKSDLLKNFPDPRWGGKPLNISHHGRKRTGSGGPLLDEGDLTSGYGSTGGDNAHPLLNASGGLGGHGTIGSVTLDPKVRKSKGHARTMSDASLASVTTDMAKSALFKGVTEHGTIQLQLPKDSFRILMDSSLEAGCVYKRKLVDNEDEFFVEFHTIEDNLAAGSHHHNQANAKRLPPDLYVMAVDSTLYRRILDEVVDSQNMPCGTFFCGHHEDVRHPDVKIAAFIVGIVFIVLLAGTVTMKG